MEETEKGKEKVNQKTKVFRLRTSGLFLTYPQCSIQPSEALPLLQEICKKKKRKIVEYVIAQEKHKDGNDHLHCFLKLDKLLDVSNQAFFDLGNHHGNYQSAKSATKVKKYCAKGGSFIADPPYTPPEATTTWKTTIQQARAGQIHLALETLENGGEKSCRDLILHSTAIWMSLKSLAPVSVLPCARELTSYGTLFEWDRARTLVICGETNTGKTTLAASLLPKALFTRHLDLLANLREGHEGIIMDDMSFKHLHDEGQIALLDVAMETQVHVRYKVAILPAGLPRIITTNREPLDVVNMVNPAIARRVQCIRWLGWERGWEEIN